MTRPFDASPAIARGVNGCGLDIDASGLSRMATKAEAYAFTGDRHLYLTAIEMIAERLEAMGALAADLRAELAAETLARAA